MEEVQVKMSAGEAAAFEEWKRKQAQEKARAENMAAYRAMVDDTIERAYAEMAYLSDFIIKAKSNAIRTIIELVHMKREVVGLKNGGQWSHTFTNSDATRRISLGCNTLDGWHDTVNEGIELVYNYISGLARDDESVALKEMVITLLRKDARGQLNAQKVLELRKIADKIKSEAFEEGVRLIEESHFLTPSRIYIKVEERDDLGGWRRLPLGVTDAEVGEDIVQLLLESMQYKSENGSHEK